MIEQTNRRFDYFVDTSSNNELVTRVEALRRHGTHAVHRAEYGLSSVLRRVDPIYYARGH